MPNLKLLRHSLKELEEARPGYIEADRFYKGTFAEPFQSLVMQRLLVRKEVNYKAVLSAVPVDAVVEKLEIVDIQSSDEEITQFLQDEVWKANQLQFVHKTAILAAEKFGDAYIFVWPEYDDEEQVVSEERSEEHTSELQSRRDLVCRLLLEKKKKKNNKTQHLANDPLYNT